MAEVLEPAAADGVFGDTLVVSGCPTMACGPDAVAVKVKSELAEGGVVPS